MPRIPVATVIGLIGFVVYCVAAVTLADRVLAAAWPLQAVYFLLAGTAWVLPARWLMLWAARLR